MSEGRNNTGNGNTGYGNTGDRNTGNWNTGDRNTGNWNTGYGNTGYGNTGDRNTGNWNTGYGNTGDRNSGIFCTIEPVIFAFNKPTNKKFAEIDHPDFSNYYLTEWIPIGKMTDEEKKKFPNYGNTEGCLRTYTDKEMWARGWAKDSEANKKKFLNLPNFDPDIFFEITGIDVREKDKESCDGKIIEIEGAKYRLTKV